MARLDVHDEGDPRFPDVPDQNVAPEAEEPQTPLDEARAYLPGTSVPPFEQKDGTWFTRAVRLKSGVQAFTAHGCRHSFAFNWMRSGGNVVVLQALLGHASIGLTAHYARPSHDAIRADAAKVHLAS